MSILTVILLCLVVLLLTVLVYQIVLKSKLKSSNNSLNNQLKASIEKVNYLYERNRELGSLKHQRELIIATLDAAEAKARNEKKGYVISGINYIRNYSGQPIPVKSKSKRTSKSKK